MTMVPLHGTLSSAAGSALSQTAGSETERSQKDAVSQRRAADANEHAEQSAGIGQTEQDQETSERDADGRRLWERPGEQGRKADSDDSKPATGTDVQIRQSKDPTGQSGTKLDLTG
jgi:hypothetical protein